MGKAPAGIGLLDEGNPWGWDWQSFGSPAYGDWPKALRDSLGKLKLDQTKVQEQVRRSLEEAGKAYDNALRSSSNATWAPAYKALRDFHRSKIDVDDNASVTVRSTGQKVKSIVKADESGTIVVVCNPKPRLTAHDKDGKLLFDGDVETPEQRAKVPPELWEKVEPLLDKVAPKVEEESEKELAPTRKQSSLDRRPPPPRRPPSPPTL